MRVLAKTKRALWIAAGSLFLLLGVMGAFLPMRLVLPLIAVGVTIHVLSKPTRRR